MAASDLLPSVNAALNGASAAFVLVGWRAIRRKNVNLHRRAMLAAFTASTLFLASYLTRFYLTGAHRFPGVGPIRVVYLAVLITHTGLAAATPPLVLRTLFLARRGRFSEHRRIAKFTLPIWLYVSVTGVLVYVMLYHLV